MKFFIVGRKNVILGKEIVKNKIIFTIGKSLHCQVDFARAVKIKDNIIIQNNFKNKNKIIGEDFFLLVKTIESNFGKNRIFIDSLICEFLCKYDHPKAPKSKYKISTDVYNDPSHVPWNFMPTEIEDILSYFKKDILVNKKILYIGAGYGKNIWALKDNGYNYEIDAIEYSRIAAKRANVIFGRKVVVHKDLLFLKDCKKKYDFVLDIGCLHCIPIKLRQKAIDVIYDSLKEDGIVITRIFKPRDKKWIKRMPFEISEFGLNEHEIKKITSNKFIVKQKYEHDDYKILEFKKC